MQLSDSRQLGYAEWGGGSSPVVFDLHGGPGCRLITSGDAGVLATATVRWITVDRPGLGLSDPCPGRRVADWPADVAQLADRLGVEEFAVVGWSMGGPYAAACAALLQNRVTRLALLASAPLSLPNPGGPEGMGKAVPWILARDDPWKMAELYTALALEARRNPSLALQLFTDGCSPTELALFAEPAVADGFIAMIIEATRQGSFGLVADMRVEVSPWGFDPASISAATGIWQGDDDSFVPIEAAEAWETAIKGAELQRLPGEGHLFPFTRTEELLDFVTAV